MYNQDIIKTADNGEFLSKLMDLTEGMNNAEADTISKELLAKREDWLRNREKK